MQQLAAQRQSPAVCQRWTIQKSVWIVAVAAAVDVVFVVDAVAGVAVGLVVNTAPVVAALLLSVCAAAAADVFVSRVPLPPAARALSLVAVAAVVAVFEAAASYPAILATSAGARLPLCQSQASQALNDARSMDAAAAVTADGSLLRFYSSLKQGCAQSKLHSQAPLPPDLDFDNDLLCARQECILLQSHPGLLHLEQRVSLYGEESCTLPTPHPGVLHPEKCVSLCDRRSVVEYHWPLLP